MKKYLQPDGKITFCRVDKNGLALLPKKKKGDKKENKSERKGPVRL